SNNQDTGTFKPGGDSDLDYTVTPNQHARVDILTAGAGPFDSGAGVLANYYNDSTLAPIGGTNPWVHYSFYISSVVAGGRQFQIRFAEVDNQLFFQQGVDNVSILASSGAVPEPGSIALLGLGFVGVAVLRRQHRMRLA